MSRLIGPPPPSAPGATGPSRGGPRVIPEDLLREASRRLAVIALLGAALWLVGSVLAHIAFYVTNPADPRAGSFHFPDLVSLVGVVSSLALYAYARRPHQNCTFTLDLGLAYLVLTSLDIAIIGHWSVARVGTTIQPEVSWIGAVVLMFAALIPNTPRKTLVTSLIAVTMNPISMLIARARGTWDFGSTSNVFLMHYPDYLLVGVAYVISHVLTRMGQHVSKAREMGSYHVGELLGKGGMGEVYRATHRMLARPAAIKLIRPDVLAGDPESIQLAINRFKREAEIAASLQSPHTVVLYDFGVTEEQSLYFVMELLEGMNLERLVRQHGPLPPGRTVFLLQQICESLEEAHARGLVHRDIKPANIHVGRIGVRHDFVKVLDFGLAKSVRSNGRGETAPATAAGVVPGTPEYMAPEMTTGQSVDGRADIYALGCVAYYMLTGQQVFEGANVFHLISRHLNEQPVPPSQRSPQPIPAELERVVLDCLAKEPDRRPASASLLATELAAVPADNWGEEQALAWWQHQALTSKN